MTIPVQSSNKIMFYPRRQKIMKISKRKNKKKMATTTPTTTTTMAPLPDDIIFFHILPRLPIRCLLRFTCVSNLWYTTIHHDPNFIASHYIHAKSNTSLVAICLAFRSHCVNFLHFEKKEEEEEKGGEHHHHHHPIYDINSNASVDLQLEHLIVVGSCNGLTCSLLYKTIQITNHSTRELLVIRRPKQSKAAATICLAGTSQGFGFDPLMNEYKYIQNYVDCSGYYECWVYTLGSNLWRNITTTCNDCLSYCVPIDQAPICISGAVFWRTCSYRGILSFDLHQEKFQFIPCPQVPQGSICYTLFEMEGGRPCLVYRHGVQLTFYTLKDHHHLNGMHTRQQHKASSCSGGCWIRLGYDIRIPKMPATKSIRVVPFYKEMYLQWVTTDGVFMLCNVNRLEIQNKYTVMYRYRSVILVNHVENLISLKTFVPPSADEDEIRYVSSREAIHESSREAIHESPTTITDRQRRELLRKKIMSPTTSSTDRQRREVLLREKKRRRLLTLGCLTIPCWVSR